jgi:phospholipid/cholesterol/gamma-HCH transport system permease protein
VADTRVEDARIRPAPERAARSTSRIARIPGMILTALVAPFAYVGSRALFLLRSAEVWRHRFHGSLLARQLQFVGFESIPIVALVGFFSGGVAAESSLAALKMFRQEATVGGIVGVSLARELAPVFTALMLSARAGAGMAAEIGSMRITEQIDALVSFGAEPTQHLVMPRVVAGMLMTPVMTMVFNVVGLVGAYLVAVHLRHVDPGGVLHSFRFYTDPLDYLEGAVKATAFGIAFTLLACYQGFNVRGGARELGRATTNAVVEGAVAILVLDYFLTDLMLVIWPPRTI